MIKAVFLDFYGTIVYEDGEVIDRIAQEIFDTGSAESKASISEFWWNAFQSLTRRYYGKDFKTQREIEYISLAQTILHFHSSASADMLCELLFAYWVKPPIFEESKTFFEKCPVPIYIVSNIDRNDILNAIKFHGLKPDGVYTSEDAKSYKPRPELFTYALEASHLEARDILHIGDSLSSDICGAATAGIRALLINRGQRTVPSTVTCIQNLIEILPLIK